MAATDIESNLEAVQKRITQACQRAGRQPEGVTLIAVTKTIDPEIVEASFKLGIRHFGENRVQEAEKKIKALSHLQPALTWHMIGHLQTNKVKLTLELFDIIQSVDSIELALTLSRRAPKRIPILLQVNVTGESTKSGFSPDEIISSFESIFRLANMDIRGLMTIAPLVNNPEEVRPVFKKLKKLADDLHLEQLSMGMTDDFEVAVEEGATMVRIGRALFGERK